MTLFSFHPWISEPVRSQVAGWLRSLGVDSSDVREGHVEQTDDGYELHLVEYLRNEHGQRYVSKRPTELATRQRVIRLERADWPGAEVPGGDQPGDAALGA